MADKIKNKISNNYFKIVLFVFCLSAGFSFVQECLAASLYLKPVQKTFTVGSTFDVSLFLNTGGHSVNTIEAELSFPVDKLQLISPSIDQKSIIELWVAQPTVDNNSGKALIRGGIPNGINTSEGLISKMSFRVKGVGRALLKINDNSSVLANNGRGENVLRSRASAIYDLKMPPPEGPEVISGSHPDQSAWVNDNNLYFSWITEEEVEGFSYILSEDPLEKPDDISEGKKNSVVYKDLTDGKKYFHIKSLRNGFWGGTTHYAVNIDKTPPADFSLEISPSARTASRKPIIEFFTSDRFSGIDHYEIKLVPMRMNEDLTEAAETSESIFIEAGSPYISPELELGEYDVIVRAYDKAGNFIESKEEIKIINPILQFTAKGLIIGTNIGKATADTEATVPWLYIILFLIMGISGLIFYLYKLRKKHKLLADNSKNKLPEDIKKKLEELVELKKKYSNLAKIIILAVFASLLLVVHPLRAQEINQENDKKISQKEQGDVQSDDEISKENQVMGQGSSLNPPIITSLSENISNDEIFYIGGKTEEAKRDVYIYLQSKTNRELQSFHVVSDGKGDWFYRHNGFLGAGDYIIWTQVGRDGNLSPPSGQKEIKVEKKALQLGASRLSMELIFSSVSVLLLAIIILLAFILFLSRKKLKEKVQKMDKEVSEVDQAIKSGFAVLRRDLQTELDFIKKLKLNKALSREELNLEKQLMEDFEKVKQNINKELLDVEKLDFD